MTQSELTYNQVLDQEARRLLAAGIDELPMRRPDRIMRGRPAGEGWT